MEHRNFLVTRTKRLKRISSAEGDCSKRIRSQRPNFHSLPEDIVSSIMSELTIKEAVRTSVVSSKWRQAWRCHPNLSFDISSVLGRKAERNQSANRYKRMLSIKRFVDWVDYIMRKHSGFAVNKVSIKFELRKEHANRIDGWVLFAIASKARVVILDFSPYLGSYENNFRFPFHLFNSQNASYLQSLTLDSVNFWPSPDFCGFANLKILALDHVLASQDLQCFLSKCPVLEWLSIRQCYQLHGLHASEPLCRLKYLCVQDCPVDKIEFLAPNLTTFEYRGSQTLIKLHECLNLKTASITFIVENTLEYVFTGLPNALPHVETLRVEVFVRSQMPVFKHVLPRFTHLKHLTLRIEVAGKIAILQLAYLLEVAPFLENLHLDMCCFNCSEPSTDGDVIVNRPHHYLKTACITGFRGDKGQVELAKYIMRNALELEHLIIEPRGRMLNRYPSMDEYHGRFEANLKLVPHGMDGVLTIL